ncbi:MAG: alpha/beta hydrolase [Burkholderiales bacterium]|nr:MAG: alpha/beta hydrolase [Burkholderiales bacterium]TAG50222.1 MAG: alpha/beta hydrolase [Betaproteobacteria bacterium]
MPQPVSVKVRRNGRDIALECAWVGDPDARDTMVFIHEGLGSVSMWRDFPDTLCKALGMRGLVYSRYGYGKSTPRPLEERWQSNFLHIEGQNVLPQLLAALRIERPWLFGHSDGGSIALIYAATIPMAVQGIITLAPHVFVEQKSIDAIELAKDAYTRTDLRERLSRHHADVDSAFWGWNDVWLSAEFREWHISDALSHIVAPCLTIQGEDDEYGTDSQAETVARDVQNGELMLIPNCGHSPHRDQPEIVIEAVCEFVAAQRNF